MHRAKYLAVLLALTTGVTQGQITGTVVDADTAEPVADARVRIQATTQTPAVTAGDGRFSLDAGGATDLVVTASVPYDPARAVNYITSAATADDGDDVLISLTLLPEADQASYEPSTSVECATCHLEQFEQWQGSRHAGAGVNPWVLDLFSGNGTPDGANGFVFRDTHDDDDTGFCATCHTPLADAQNPGGEFMDEVTLDAGLDGVNCLACHQMAEVNDNTNGLHHLGNTLYRFPADASTSLWVWGPLDDVSFDIMRASYQPGFSESRFCASCHQYNNPDTGAPGQTTYTEWLASPFAEPGEDFRTCQTCHMPQAEEPGPISSLFGQPERPAEQRHAHDMVGSTPATLDAAIDVEVDVSVDGTALNVQARVANVGAGHAFPTGVSIRNAVLVVEARAGDQPLALLDGPVVPFYGSADGGGAAQDVAGRPGRGYARVLEGRINGEGPVEYPVLFIDAETVQSDTRIAAGETDLSDYRFDLSGIVANDIQVEARLLYRRAWRDLAVTKNWTETPSGDPVETEVERVVVSVAGPGPVQMIPALGPWMMTLLSALLMLAAAPAIAHRGRRRPENLR